MPGAVIPWVRRIITQFPDRDCLLQVGTWHGDMRQTHTLGSLVAFPSMPPAAQPLQVKRKAPSDARSSPKPIQPEQESGWHGRVMVRVPNDITLLELSVTWAVPHLWSNQQQPAHKG